jgi:hypothetical protein
LDNTDVKRQVILVKKKRNLVQGVSNKHQPTVGDIIIAKALPFRFAIVTLLHRRGFYTDKLTFKYLLIKFYNQFVAKKQVDESAFVNSVVFKIKPNDKTSGEIDEARNKTSFGDIMAIADNVINSFRNAKIKYQVHIENGLNPEQLLTDEELTMAKAVFVIERELLKKSHQDNYVSSGELRKVIWWFLIIGIVFWFLK